MQNKKAIIENLTRYGVLGPYSSNMLITEDELIHLIHEAETEIDIFAFLKNKQDEFVSEVNRAIRDDSTEVQVRKLYFNYWNPHTSPNQLLQYFLSQKYVVGNHFVNGKIIKVHEMISLINEYGEDLPKHVSVKIDFRLPHLKFGDYEGYFVSAMIPGSVFTQALNRPAVLKKSLNNISSTSEDEDLYQRLLEPVLAESVLQYKKDQIISTVPDYRFIDMIRYLSDDYMKLNIPNIHGADKFPFFNYLRSTDKSILELVSNDEDRFCLDLLGKDTASLIHHELYMKKFVYQLSQNMYFKAVYPITDSTFELA